MSIRVSVFLQIFFVIIGSASFIYMIIMESETLVSGKKVLIDGTTYNVRYTPSRNPNKALTSSGNYLSEINDRILKAYSQFVFRDSRLRPRTYTLVPRRNFCENTTFIVVVHIRLGDDSLRNMWRATYGNEKLKNKYNYNLLFSIGVDKDHNHKLQQKIVNESNTYGDILQADYVDSYKNLTLKQLAELRFIASECMETKGIIKLDDDVGWNVEKVARFINNNMTYDELYCSRRANDKPIRRPKSKWSVKKEEWNRSRYPIYCPGMVYITSTDVIQQMLEVVHLQEFFWIDDVFITGVLTEASNVSVVSYPGISVRKKIPEKLMTESFFLVQKQKTYYWFVVSNPEAAS